MDQIERQVRAAAPHRFRKPPVPVATGCLLMFAWCVVGALSATLLWAHCHGGAMTESRISRAFGIALLVLMTVQTCVQMQHPRRGWLAYASLAVMLPLMTALIYGALFRD